MTTIRSIIRNILKMFEIFLFKQMSEYFDSFFSKFQSGLRKGYNAQYC